MHICKSRCFATYIFKNFADMCGITLQTGCVNVLMDVWI